MRLDLPGGCDAGARARRAASLRVGAALLLAAVLAAPAAAALLLAAVLAAPAAAAPRYTLDTDPIRLADRAFDAGRLADAAARYREAVEAGHQVARANLGLGAVAHREGRTADAERFYRAALAARFAEDAGADYPEARGGLGLTLLRFGRPAEAAAEFDRALAVEPDLWTAAYGRARLALADGRWEEARGFLERGAKRRGVAEGEDAWHFGRALLAEGTGDLDRATDEALTAFHMNPADPEHGLLVAALYERRGVPLLAIDTYEKALAVPDFVPSATLWHGLGALYEKVGRHTEARDAWLKAVAADSAYVPALRDLASLYARSGQPDLAARVYLRLVGSAPEDVDSWVALAEACLAAPRPREALDAARRAVALAPARVDARFALARAGIAVPDTAARAEAARLYAGLPDSLDWTADDHLAFAADLRAAKHHDAARAAAARALALEPGRAAAHFEMGLLDLADGRPDSAATRFEAAAGLDSTSALYALNLGIARFQAKRFAGAIAPFRRAVTLNDRLAVGHVLLGQALAMSDSLGAAERAYRRALELEPENPKALRGLGYCAIRRADYAEAARRYRAAAGIEPGSADAWAGLGNACLGLQNWDEAETAFRRARAIDPANTTMLKGMELLEQARKGGG